ncbi:MAG: ABC transporter ATP-binding protein [Spirochaetaceae bacterium]
MIKFKSVSKKYGDFIALNNLNIEVKEGDLCILLGPSGCGKSTSLRLINRLIEMDSGIIEVNGKDITTLPAEILRRGIGYVIQNVGLLPHYTVKENISIVPKLLKWSSEKIDNRVLELLDLVGLNPEMYSNKYPNQLSGGEAQRIGVARALAADPPILLMDEPFGAVDPLTRTVLQNEFLKIQKKLKKTVIFVTHDIEEAVTLGNKIAILKNGTLMQYDSPDKIITLPKCDFISEFTGKDRSLKLLLYYYVEKIINTDFDIERWVIEGDDIILKGDDGKSVYNIERDTVESSSSLKDALAIMLKLSRRTLPVIENKKVIGEVYLKDIEEIFGKANE